MKKTVLIFNKECTLTFAKYKNNTIAMEAIEANGDPFLMITINYEANWEGTNSYEQAFPFPCVVIKNYSENEGVINDLVKANVITHSGAYLAGSGGTVEVRGLSEEWAAIAKQQLETPTAPATYAPINSPTVIDWDVFEEKYKPVKNHFQDSAPLNDWMYETYGEELAHVEKILKEKGENYIWTFLDGGGGEVEQLISSGMWYINRMGFVITEIPWEGERGMIDVYDEDDKTSTRERDDEQEQALDEWKKG